MSSPSDLVVHMIKQDCIEGVAAMDGGSGKSWSSLINESFVIFPAPLSDWYCARCAMVSYSSSCPVAASPSLVGLPLRLPYPPALMALLPSSDRTSPTSLYFEAAIEVAIPTRGALSIAATTDDVREAGATNDVSFLQQRHFVKLPFTRSPIRLASLAQALYSTRSFPFLWRALVSYRLDDLVWPFTNLRVQERQSRVCSTVAIAIIARTCGPFTCILTILNGYPTTELNHNAPVKPKQIFANPGPYQMARKSPSQPSRAPAMPYDLSADRKSKSRDIHSYSAIAEPESRSLSLYPRPGYTIELEWERSQRRWAAGAPVNPNWKSIILEEQQNIMNSIKQSAESSVPRNPGESPTEEWPPGGRTAPVNEAPHVEVPAQPPPPQPPQHQEECEKSSVPPPTCSAHRPSDSRSMLSHDQDGHAPPKPDELSQSQPSRSKPPVDKPPVTPDRWEGSLGHSSGSIRSVASDRSIGWSPPKPESFQALTLPGYQKLEEETRRKEKEIWEREAALFTREEEVKQHEVEAKRKEDDVRRKEQQAKKLEEEEK
ncbi:hypothetical protein CPB84DRAFT_1844082 [Gymnopilus junonius]|uniref:Uncharacterized protein n=1 Tax=Gymnopilus junonius TaxID=109634 RepID=A0A9P5NWI6_GYMJU|nr:hypothetical protein CPB84DRAFT_1844082 [Gymnopilus junonius]